MAGVKLLCGIFLWLFDLSQVRLREGSSRRLRMQRMQFCRCFSPVLLVGEIRAGRGCGPYACSSC